MFRFPAFSSQDQSISNYINLVSLERFSVPLWVFSEPASSPCTLFTRYSIPITSITPPSISPPHNAAVETPLQPLSLGRLIPTDSGHVWLCMGPSCTPLYPPPVPSRSQTRFLHRHSDQHPRRRGAYRDLLPPGHCSTGARLCVKGRAWGVLHHRSRRATLEVRLLQAPLRSDT